MECPLIRFTTTEHGFGFWDFDDFNIIILATRWVFGVNLAEDGC